MVDEKDPIKEYISKLIKPIFDEALKGNQTDTMGVGGCRILWRPNNYQIKIPYSKRTFKEHPTKKCSFPVELKESNYGSKHTFRLSRKLTIVLDPNTATIFYSSKDDYGKRQWYLVNENTFEEAEEVCVNIKINIKNKMIRKLKEIIRVYGGCADYEKYKWLAYDDGCRGEELLDSLPEELIIKAPNLKKLYKDESEFKGIVNEEPTRKMFDYMNNLATERQAPKILEKLEEIGQKLNNIDNLNKTIGELSQATLLEIENKKLHMEVERKQSSNQEVMNKSLNRLDKTLNKILGIKQKTIKEYTNQEKLSRWIV